MLRVFRLISTFNYTIIIKSPMKLIAQIALAAAAFGVMSCSDSGKTENTATTTNTPATVAPNQPGTPATTAALNPAHGQPGHRCDIEVGAPLDAPAQPRLQTPPVFTPPSTNPATGTTAPGTNPPHGQPGHDCGIPVGAPLIK
jgi:hypothetical protein